MTPIPLDLNDFLKVVDKHYPDAKPGRRVPLGSGFTYRIKPEIMEWAKENDVACRPNVELCQPVTAHCFIQHSIVVQDDASAILFKLRWL